MKTNTDELYLKINDSIQSIQKTEETINSLLQEKFVAELYLSNEEYDEASVYFNELVEIFLLKKKHAYKHLYNLLGDYFAKNKNRTN